jgi:hypothetical protein
MHCAIFRQINVKNYIEILLVALIKCEKISHLYTLHVKEVPIACNNKYYCILHINNGSIF